MRFAELLLERYGHFEDRRLTFAAGAPDFHIVYGPNEAGKSTTLAAISDLLFGFDPRCAYNFRFDYRLLRVGAVLEEDGARFICRRRKTRDDSLIDAEDQRLDEGQLSALLHGLTRDTFAAGFSLDQEGLRRGGEAMIHASDDVGKALFAAGSGLTGIAEVQAALDAELDAIWGKRASDRRTFSAAAKRLEISLDVLRRSLLKPKDWADARARVDECERVLKALQQRQRELGAERTRAERLRRIGPAMRERAALIAALAEAGETVAFSVTEETAAQAALTALSKAAQDRMAALKRRDDVADRLKGLDADPIVDAGDRIERLIERRGAITDAAAELTRLDIERTGMEQRAGVLRGELALTGAPPTTLHVRKLRDIATRHAALATGLKTRERDLADRRARAQTLREALADAPLPEGLDALRAAIAVTRGLGDDFDERCEQARTTAERLEAEARTALAALAPWQGDAEALAIRLPADDGEIQAAADADSRLSAKRDDARTRARQLADEAQVLDARRAELARTGKAVSVEELADARQARDARWQTIAAHLRGQPVEAPAALADAYAQTVTAADAVADRRYDAAEASARLAVLDHDRTLKGIEQEQAGRAVTDAEEALVTARQAWEERLRAQSLPPLAPLALRAWQAQRRVALERHAAAIEARQAMLRSFERRATALADLRAVVRTPPDTERLLPMLEAAERERLAGEALDRSFRDKRTALSNLEDEIERQERQDAHDRRALEAVAAEWTAEQGRLSIALDIGAVAGWLELVEDLRNTLEKSAAHDRRMQGIASDRTAFDAAVAGVVKDIGMEAGDDPAWTLDTLRARLIAARAVARDIATLSEERKKHQAEADRAGVDADIALETLRPILTRAGVEAAESLPPLLERSKTQRDRKARLAEVERRIVTEGDQLPLSSLIAAWNACNPDEVAAAAAELEQELRSLEEEVAKAAAALGEARKDFDILDQSPQTAADAAADAEAAKADMRAEADVYVLKRVQSLMLRWAMERYRERSEAPLLKRASALFRTLTLGRFVELKVDYDAAVPRLLGLRADRETLVSIDGLSEGTRDQLFLALRLAAVEQSLAAGVRVPFLADDLFVNFDDERAMAGVRVLGELAGKTQVLLFTHHAHVRDMGAAVCGGSCALAGEAA